MISLPELIAMGFSESDLSDLWMVVADTDDGTDLEEELRRELAEGHVLDGADVVAAAIRMHRKECIFWVRSLRRWAWVHLTQSAESDPRWPSTVLCENWDALLVELADGDRR